MLIESTTVIRQYGIKGGGFNRVQPNPSHSICVRGGKKSWCAELVDFDAVCCVQGGGGCCTFPIRFYELQLDKAEAQQNSPCVWCTSNFHAAACQSNQ